MPLTIHNQRRGCARNLQRTVAAAALCALFAPSHAFQIDAGPDWDIRLDTTVRYNLGVRAENCDKNICGDGQGAGDITAHQSDRRFGKRGDIVTNRIDVLPEFDAVYQGRYGLRVSGAGWFDAAYSNRLKGDPLLSSISGGAFQGAGPTGGRYTDYTKRWSIGPSAEFLDAFVFARFDIADRPLNVRLGQHNIYWGESLFSFVNGISYGQGPVDIRKAQANPGIEAKEVFKPLNQISFTYDLTDRVSLAGQYLFDWKPSSLPEGGTYFGAVDGLSMGGGTSITGIPFGGVLTEPKNKRGDWGLALRWRPEWFDGSLGFYVRRYKDKFPQLVMGGNQLIAQEPYVVPTLFGLDYSSPRATMYAISIAKPVGDTSVGVDLTYRTDAQLLAVPLATPGAGANLGAGAVGNSMLPTGKMLTGTVNAIHMLGKSRLYDSATLMGEVNFSHLISVSRNPGSFSGKGYNCASYEATGFPYGCPTKNAIGLALGFTPIWYQPINGVDISMPLFVSVGIKGNSAVMFGDNQGQGSYSMGVTANIRNQYELSLKYNGFIAKHRNDELGSASYSNASLGKYWDRGWFSLTFKTTF